MTYGHIYNSFPYKNTVDMVELKGEDVIALFESVVAHYDKDRPMGSFLQVSGNNNNNNDNNNNNNNNNNNFIIIIIIITITPIIIINLIMSTYIHLNLLFDYLHQ